MNFKVCTKIGKEYALPWTQASIKTLIYRKEPPHQYSENNVPLCKKYRDISPDVGKAMLPHP